MNALSLFPLFFRDPICGKRKPAPWKLGKAHLSWSARSHFLVSYKSLSLEYE